MAAPTKRMPDEKLYELQLRVAEQLRTNLALSAIERQEARLETEEAKAEIESLRARVTELEALADKYQGLLLPKVT